MTTSLQNIKKRKISDILATLAQTDNSKETQINTSSVQGSYQGKRRRLNRSQTFNSSTSSDEDISDEEEVTEECKTQKSAKDIKKQEKVEDKRFQSQNPKEVIQILKGYPLFKCYTTSILNLLEQHPNLKLFGMQSHIKFLNEQNGFNMHFLRHNKDQTCYFQCQQNLQFAIKIFSNSSEFCYKIDSSQIEPSTQYVKDLTQVEQLDEDSFRKIFEGSQDYFKPFIPILYKLIVENPEFMFEKIRQNKLSLVHRIKESVKNKIECRFFVDKRLCFKNANVGIFIHVYKDRYEIDTQKMKEYNKLFENEKISINSQQSSQKERSNHNSASLTECESDDYPQNQQISQKNKQTKEENKPLQAIRFSTRNRGANVQPPKNQRETSIKKSSQDKLIDVTQKRNVSEIRPFKLEEQASTKEKSMSFDQKNEATAQFFKKVDILVLEFKNLFLQMSDKLSD